MAQLEMWQIMAPWWRSEAVHAWKYCRLADDSLT
jgi:hypothetical protein